MIINPVIVAALLVQAFVGQISKLAAALVGYAITTGILFWGSLLYADGDAIAFFGVPLSQPVFHVLCLVWLVYDTKEFRAARGEAVGEEATDLMEESESADAASQPALSGI